MKVSPDPRSRPPMQQSHTDRKEHPGVRGASRYGTVHWLPRLQTPGPRRQSCKNDGRAPQIPWTRSGPQGNVPHPALWYVFPSGWIFPAATGMDPGITLWRPLACSVHFGVSIDGTDPSNPQTLCKPDQHTQQAAAQSVPRAHGSKLDFAHSFFHTWAQKKFTPRSWGSCPPVANPTSVPRETAGCADVVFSPRTQCPPPGSNCVIKTLVPPAVIQQQGGRLSTRTKDSQTATRTLQVGRRLRPLPEAAAFTVGSRSSSITGSTAMAKMQKEMPQASPVPLKSLSLPKEQRADRQTLPAATPCPTGKHPWIRTSREQAEGSRLQAVAWNTTESNSLTSVRLGNPARCHH